MAGDSIFLISFAITLVPPHHDWSQDTVSASNAWDAVCCCACVVQAVVFVWDLDESLVLLHSLITGSYAAAVGAADAGRLADLGRHMQALVMKLIDERMHFKQVAQHSSYGTGLACWGDTGQLYWAQLSHSQCGVMVDVWKVISRHHVPRPCGSCYSYLVA